MNSADKKQSLLPLWAMLVVLGAPLMAALAFWYNQDWIPEGRSNHGELVAPPWHLPLEGLVNVHGDPWRTVDLQGYWTVALVAGAECGDPCRKRIYGLKQLHKALGESQRRVRRMLILPLDLRDADLNAFLNNYRQMGLALADARTLALNLEPLGETQGRIFLVDPRGDVMMRYEPDAPFEDVLKDMEVLLKVTKGWANPEL